VAAFAPGELGAAWKHLLTPILTGILVDIIYKLYGERSRLFAFCLPSVAVVSWFIMLVLISKKNNLLGWSIHATIGVVFLAGCASLMLSFLSESDGNIIRE